MRLSLPRTRCPAGLAQRWSALRERWASGVHARTRPIAQALPVRVGVAHLSASPSRPSLVQGWDVAFVWVTAALLAWGLVMVYSASIAMPENPRFARYSPTYFFYRHALWLVLGLMLAWGVYRVPLRTWEHQARALFIVSLVLLVLVLLPGIGKVVYGARRWVGLGPVSFQPSELVKFSMLIYAADYMVRKMSLKEKFWQAVWPMALAVGAVGVLLLAEPDMGAFMVIAVIAMGVLFLGGVNARMFFFIAALLLAAFAAIIAASPWRRERIFAYLDPWSEQNALAKGYQLTHALIAIGRGEVFGVGLGGSVEKLSWLPEAHTDFLLAVIGEEFGFVGVSLVLVAFFWLVRRMMQIGRQAIAMERVFDGLVAQGVALWIGFQAFINLGVNLGALPTKGLTLPLMSYGGSAVLINLMALAVVLRVDSDNRVVMHGGRV